MGDGLDACIARDADTVAFELCVDEGAELVVDGGSTSGSCSICVTESPRMVSPSAISRPMYPAPMMTARLTAGRSSVRGELEGVIHRVQYVNAIFGAEPVQAGDPGSDR